MAVFNYKVVDKNGKNKKGTIEAPNRDGAEKKLKADGYAIMSLTEQNSPFSGGLIKKKVKSKDLAVFCKQFSAVIRAGVTIISALELMGDQIENKTLQRAVMDAKTYVEKGGTLADALRVNSEVFPPIMINMVAAGELSGNLEICLDRLTEHFEKDNALSAKIKGAMTYPIVVFIVMIIVVIVVMVMVIPNFSSMFAEMGTQLPLATRIMVAASNFIIHKWWLLIIIVAAIVVGCKAFKRSSVGEQLFANMAIKMPIFGNLTIKSACSRFARTMSTLMASGISMIDAVEQVAKMMDNKIIRDGLLDAKTQVAKGIPLSKPLKDMEMLPPMLSAMTKIGEETGDIEEMLSKVADYYDEEVEEATNKLTAAMEPLIMVVLACIVGMIVAAVYGPIMSMYSALDQY
ncbi:type II secretion system F family protein [Coprococcus eutactus]|jgi:type IV pilus assembly protein PilC|uniref:Type II secretion system F family protein n=1 Tax=Coprococcus ammoniilyticus TaxID=2981785 RepID=A0ABV1EH48_9FIRM|nr:type II secretion system F family protein [Coprococcus ammoniilyticus]NSE51801.1 type II secretion system F family protein [Coprococcus eutactus]RGH09022.1 type II secretion system F family protein [Clostridium sp. AF15-31]CCY61192.1 bacterial type II secretion system domain protein F [Clostridium sp. CAG:264]SCH88940.1 Cholera toxin secretion protein epsF [uncultured Coprococcus sp.]MCU6730992.1 type II secretion system F family protein [Coprococcus ammoniilyticus]